jgi:DNA-binding NarL/FixJ family response regulator
MSPIRILLGDDHNIAVMIDVAMPLMNGASGYLLKDSLKSELIAAIRALAAGGRYFDPRVCSLLKDEREREVLQLVAEGRSNKEMAAALNLSLYTVDTHRSRKPRKGVIR